MTFKVNHAYTSAIPDDPADLAAGKITPSRWNADLVATMSSGRIAGRVSAGVGAVEELDSSTVAGLLGLGSAAYSSTSDFAASSHTHSAADITSGTFADARIAQSNVTQHQAALSISWTQIGGKPTTLAGYGITDAAPLSHVGSGGAAHANAVPNGAAGFMTGADKNKLDGIQAGATANSSDAFLLNRANHTGTQTASTISDFAAAARAETEAELIAGANITITPAGSGPTRTLTISAAGGGGGGGAPTDATYVTLTNNASLTNERVLTAGVGISITDGGANSPMTLDNADRGSVAVTIHEAASDPHPQYLTSAEGDAAYAPLGHVGAGGSAHANAVPNGAAGFMTGADKAKLDGIQSGATANSSDAFLLSRANHTGTQTASTISDFAAAARAETEAELIAGTNITITPAGSGATRTLTISAVDTATIQASENLAAGDFVNIHNVSGNARVRKADASTSGKEAHGFVLSAVTSGNNAVVYFEGRNTQVSGRTPGARQYLSASTPGAVTETPPTGSGNVLQYLGVAIGATTISTEIEDGIILA